MATKAKSSLRNDLAHVLPPLGMYQSYFMVRPMDDQRKYEPFVTIGTSEEEVRRLTLGHFQSDSEYSGDKLTVQWLNWAAAKGYSSSGWTPFRFLAEKGEPGYLYVEMEGIGEQFIALPFDNKPDWAMEALVRQAQGRFWIPEDRVREYVEIVRRRAKDGTD